MQAPMLPRAVLCCGSPNICTTPNRTPAECEEWVSFLREALLSTPKTIAKRRWAMLARDMGKQSTPAARPVPHRTFY